MVKINIKRIVLTKDVVLEKGTVLMDISDSKTEYSSDWFQGLVSLNKDNCAYINVNLDALKEGEDYILIKE